MGHHYLPLSLIIHPPCRLFIREQDQTLENFLTQLREQASSRTFGGHFFVAGGTLILTACKSPLCNSERRRIIVTHPFKKKETKPTAAAG